MIDPSGTWIQMTEGSSTPVPLGLRATAALFAFCGVYLGSVGALMLIRPGTASMSAGAPLLFGLELAGPYMFLLMALIAGAVAWGLLRLNNIARRIAMLIAIAGIGMLVPPASAAAATVQPGALIRAGSGIVVRVIVLWYLGRAEVAKEFQRGRQR
jgi:hypothetical protein